ESNTFGANRELLRRYGAQDRLRDINRAGVRLARQAAGRAAYVAGSVGPTGTLAAKLTAERRAILDSVFKEQIEALVEAGGDMLGHGRPVSAQPNAGRPRRLDERTIYMTTPEYFGVYARRLFQSGVALVGGCCGTGPEHVRRVVDAAAMMSGGRVKVEAAKSG